MYRKLFSTLICLAASLTSVLGSSSHYVHAHSPSEGFYALRNYEHNPRYDNEYRNSDYRPATGINYYHQRGEFEYLGQDRARAIAQYSNYGLRYGNEYEHGAYKPVQDHDYGRSYYKEYALRYPGRYSSRNYAYEKNPRYTLYFYSSYPHGGYMLAAANYRSRGYPDKYYGYHYKQQTATVLAPAHENRLKADTARNIAWQWDNNPVSVLNAIKAWPDDQSVALTKLKEGQRQNKAVQRLYDAAAEALPDFWAVVFYTTRSEANFSELESYIRWQAENDSNSLVKSEKAWRAGTRQSIWAYYHLLWGQRDNPKALKLYRACWNDNPDAVMSTVSRLLNR